MVVDDLMIDELMFDFYSYDYQQYNIMILFSISQHVPSVSMELFITNIINTKDL